MGDADATILIEHQTRRMLIDRTHTGTEQVPAIVGQRDRLPQTIGDPARERLPVGGDHLVRRLFLFEIVGMGLDHVP